MNQALKFIDEIRMAKQINCFDNIAVGCATHDLAVKDCVSGRVMNVVYSTAYSKSIEHAVVVDVENLVVPATERIERGSIVCAEEYPAFRLPYPEMWFEYRLSKGTALHHPGWDRVGMLARCINDAPHINPKLKVDFELQGVRYIEFALFGKVHGKIIGPTYMLGITVDEHGVIKNVACTNYANKTSYDRNNSHYTGDGEAIVRLKAKPIDWSKKTELAISLMIPGILAVQLMNCKNIKQIDKEPPQTLNERHRQKHPPMVKYKVLKLDLGKTGHSASSGDVKNPDMMPYHFCRGHFKTFTAEKPLLGKHVGMFWWEAHARGDRKHGEVIKDYEVKGASSGEPAITN